MSEEEQSEQSEGEEIVVERSMSDEELINTLAAVRDKKQEELQQLAGRLAVLQDRLKKVKDSLERKTLESNLDIVSRILDDCTKVYHLPDRGIQNQALQIIFKALKLQEEALEKYIKFDLS